MAVQPYFPGVTTSDESRLTTIQEGLLRRPMSTKELAASLRHHLTADVFENVEDAKKRMTECLFLTNALKESIYSDKFDLEKGSIDSHCAALLDALQDQPGGTEAVPDLDTLVKGIQRSYVDTIKSCTSGGRYTNACPDWELYMAPADELVEDPKNWDRPYRHSALSFVEIRSHRPHVNDEKTEQARSSALEFLASSMETLPTSATETIGTSLRDNVGMFTSVEDTQTDLDALVSAYHLPDRRSESGSSSASSALHDHWRKTKDALTRDLSRLKSSVGVQGGGSALDWQFKKFCRSALAHSTAQQTLDAAQEDREDGRSDRGRKGTRGLSRL